MAVMQGVAGYNKAPARREPPGECHRGLGSMKQQDTLRLPSRQGRVVTLTEAECTKCKRLLPHEAFGPHKHVRSGLDSWCKECTSTARKAHAKANPHKSRERWIKWRDRNHERLLTYHRDRHQAYRTAAHAVLGGVCECCGEPQTAFLCVDHRNGDGHEDRKRPGRSGASLFRFIANHPNPKETYRLLCYNCNMAFAIYGDCPHRRQN